VVDDEQKNARTSPFDEDGAQERRALILEWRMECRPDARLGHWAVECGTGARLIVDFEVEAGLPADHLAEHPGFDDARREQFVETGWAMIAGHGSECRSKGAVPPDEQRERVLQRAFVHCPLQVERPHQVERHGT